MPAFYVSRDLYPSSPPAFPFLCQRERPEMLACIGHTPAYGSITPSAVARKKEKRKEGQFAADAIMATAVATPVGHQTRGYDSTAAYQDKFETYLKKVGEAQLPKVSAAPINVGHSKQGSVIPLTIIDGPADWTSASLQGKQDEYTYTLSQSDVNELVAAVEKVKSRGVANEADVAKLTDADFDLPTLRSKIYEIGKQVSLGRGFQLIRGFPVEQYRSDRLGLVIAFYGLGLVLGSPQISQTDYTEDGQTFGSLLNHITVGRHTHVKRNSNHNLPPQKQPQSARQVDLSRIAFHSDQAATDLVSLLSVTSARQGGESKWVSGVAIHNELLRRGRKDLVEALSDEKAWKVPVKHDQATFKRNADGSFEGYETMPPFHYHDGWLSIYWQTNNYQEIELTPLQEEAVWTFARLAEDPDFHFSVKLEPGDIEILHNPTALHSRGEVTDGEAPAEKRHLLRWWIAQPSERNPRPISHFYAPRSNTFPEGGFRVPEGSTVRLPFWPYSRHDGNGQSTY